MILNAIIADQQYGLNVPDALLAEAEDFFSRLDADMDKGWQMSRDWVSRPDRIQRCQIVANKLLTALENENEKLGMLMAGYILSRMPEIDAVEIDIAGEIQNTQFFRTEDAPPLAGVGPSAAPGSLSGAGINESEVMVRASHDVTQVYKVGKAYRYSVYDRDAGMWRDSPMIATEEQAERLRQEAFDERLRALQGDN